MQTIQWLSHNRKAKCQANPKYPKGRKFDLRKDDVEAYCTIELPYPAPECGIWKIDCHACDRGSLGVTAAGRTDDPTMVIVPCGKVLKDAKSFN